MFRYMRGQRIAQMIQTLASEGVTIDDSDRLMLCGYLKGNVSAQDLLAHACQFSTLSAYQEWLCMTSKRYCRNSSSSPSVEQVVREFEAFIRRKHLERSDTHAPWCVAKSAIGHQ